MNRKQQRRERRIRNEAGRERHRARVRHYRAHWCNEFGDPFVVMDDPTEEHVNRLVLVWLTPRKILTTVSEQIAEKVQQHTDKVILDALGIKGDDLQSKVWSHLFRLSTFGLTFDAPATPAPTIKVW